MKGRHIIFILGSVAVFSITLVFVLFSVVNTRNEKQYGFERFYLNEKPLIGHDSLDLIYDSYYIAGQTGTTLYLGNTVAPRIIEAIDIEHVIKESITLELFNPDSLTFLQVRSLVDSPNVYLTDGTIPMIFKGTLAEGITRPEKYVPSYFIRLTPGEPNELALLALNNEQETRLGMLHTKREEIVFNERLLEKQVDGLFCTDGMIHYDKDHKLFVYLYHYRNEYLLFDSSLKLQGKGHTVDTISRAQISVVRIHSKSTSVLAAPPLVVNKQSALDHGLLYVRSVLASDNEKLSLKHYAVIDIYNIQNRSYQGSFYLSNNSKNTLKGFSVVNHQLVALYTTTLVIYDLKNIKGQLGL